MESMLKPLARPLSRNVAALRAASPLRLCRIDVGSSNRHAAHGRAHSALAGLQASESTSRPSIQQQQQQSPHDAQAAVPRYIPPALQLASGEVHIWWLWSDQVQSSALQEQYLQLLPDSEKAYVLEAANEKVRKERLLARTLVRVILARYCQPGVSPNQLCFDNSPHGKPWLVADQGCSVGGKRLHFNLTHTNELLGVAVAADRYVGLDVESSSRLTKADPIRLAKRRFSDRETACLEGFASSTERATHFMRLWTLKEAYVKATGRGISAHPGLRAFTFELLLQTTARAARSRDAGNSASPSGGDRPGSVAEERRQDAVGSNEVGSPAAVPRLRLPFWISFRAADTDRTDWEAALMDVTGGHTAALVVESREAEAALDVEPAPLRIKVFQTVPLVSEEQANEHEFRLIGYGRSERA